jgi:hypothetical protein
MSQMCHEETPALMPPPKIKMRQCNCPSPISGRHLVAVRTKYLVGRGRPLSVIFRRQRTRDVSFPPGSPQDWRTCSLESTTPPRTGYISGSGIRLLLIGNDHRT